MKKQIIYRQGDVTLIRARHKPASGKEVARYRIVLAVGESTGHEHVVAGEVALYELPEPKRIPGRRGAMSSRMVVVDGKARFAHLVGDIPTGEHGEIEMEPGVYWVLPRWSYQPEEIKRAVD
jgi:hypothetical protein